MYSGKRTLSTPKIRTPRCILNIGTEIEPGPRAPPRGGEGASIGRFLSPKIHRREAFSHFPDDFSMHSGGYVPGKAYFCGEGRLVFAEGPGVESGCGVGRPPRRVRGDRGRRPDLRWRRWVRARRLAQIRRAESSVRGPGVQSTGTRGTKYGDPGYKVRRPGVQSTGTRGTKYGDPGYKVRNGLKRREFAGLFGDLGKRPSFLTYLLYSVAKGLRIWGRRPSWIRL
jgi:hypothetical protein